MITGASGLLGHALCSMLVARGLRVVGVTHTHSIDVPGVEDVQADLSDADAARAVVAKVRPSVIIHAAAVTNVDHCEEDPDFAMAFNANLPGMLAKEADALNAKFVFISTDMLWRGDKSFVDEKEPPAPMNVYARSKMSGERQVLEACPTAIVARTNFYGLGRPWRKSFSDWVIDSLSGGASIKGFADVYFSPLNMTQLCGLLIELVGRDASGIFHFAARDRVSKYDFIHRLAEIMGLDVGLLAKAHVADLHLAAPRPMDMSLATDKISGVVGRSMPSVEDGLRLLSEEMKR
ncbi:MAG: SDR family oxidoreductase [Alphaproteobacteria bacterium]|nr:SDR family oxidoreductase [Alphaproteobacteria bacterium]